MQTILGPVTYLAVAATSAQISLVTGQSYLVTSSTNCWIKLGANPTAAAATADNFYLPANTAVRVQGSALNAKLAAIRATADGHLSAAVIA